MEGRREEARMGRSGEEHQEKKRKRICSVCNSIRKRMQGEAKGGEYVRVVTRAKEEEKARGETQVGGGVGVQKKEVE